MKKITSISMLLLLALMVSCKKEINQEEAIKSISTSVNTENVSKKNFNENILPLVEELHEKDSVKYRLIYHIAQKAKKEKNSKIFTKNVQDLKSELKFIK